MQKSGVSPKLWSSGRSRDVVIVLMVGIYRIWNVINGRVYIGKSKDILHRWDGHVSNLMLGTHPNVHLREEWKEFGSGCFVFELLEECSVQELRQKEFEWHHVFRSYSPEFGYNTLTAFDGFNNHHSDVAKMKISNGLRGRVVSDEVRARMSESARRSRTPEVRERLRMAAIEQHKRMSDEERVAINKKISDANSGRVVSAEARAKISDGVRRWWATRPGRSGVVQARQSGLSAEEGRRLGIEKMRATYARMTPEEKREKFGRGSVWVREDSCIICGKTFTAHKGRNGRWQERCEDCKGKWRVRHDED